MDIFVASLPFKVKEPELRKIFEAFGEVVSIKLIKDDKGLNKGFGFVNMPNAVEANAAIKALNGSEISGRTIIVSRSEQTNASKNKRSYTSEGATAAKRASKGSYAEFKHGGKPAFVKKGRGGSREADFKKTTGERSTFKRGGSDNQGLDRVAKEGERPTRFNEARGEKSSFKRSTGKAPFEKREPRTERTGEFKKKTAGGKGGFKSASATKSPYKKRTTSSDPKKSGGGRRGR